MHLVLSSGRKLALTVTLGLALSLASAAQGTPVNNQAGTQAGTKVDMQTPVATVSAIDMRDKDAKAQKAGDSQVSVIHAGSNTSATTDGHGDIRLGIGDLISVKVYGVPEMSEDLRVNGNGDVSMPLIGDVHVEGLTSTQVERAVETKLVDTGMLREPHVSVMVKEYVTQGVSVMGEVMKPGIYPMLGARRLFDALTIAGGPTVRAGSLVTITHHDHPETPVNVHLDPDPAKNVLANVDILPGDTIMLAKAGVIYVVGDVSKPGGYVMENNQKITVLMALAMSGGQNKNASLDKSKIIHKNTTDGVAQEIPVPLGKILAGKAKDISLEADDILFVPNSAAKSAGRNALQTALSSIVGAAIYRPF